MQESSFFLIKNNLSDLSEVDEKIKKLLLHKNSTSDLSYKVSLILEELITNTIKYAYEDDNEHLISIRMTFIENKLKLLVEDDGKYFNISQAPIPNSKKNILQMNVGGLGIHLIKSLTNYLRYERINNKNFTEVELNIE